MKYKWNGRRNKSKQHMTSDDGEALCKVENGASRDPGRWVLSDTQSSDRKICGICQFLYDRDGDKPRPRPADGRRSDLFLHTWEWKQVRYRALMAGQGGCQCCGATAGDGAVMCVDHIIPRRKRPDLALTLSNLQVLCAQCNRGKGNWDETDWRSQ